MRERVWIAALVCVGMFDIPAARGFWALSREQPMTEFAETGQVVRGRYQGSDGTRAWRLYVPSSYDRNTPPLLMVLLHGCTQNADDFARGSQMDEVAEARGFLVLYPEQPMEANPRACWNWFDAGHQRRDAGEPSIIAGLITDVMTRFPADPARVHIAGVSAGAAMAGLVAVAYPERFATLASVSGVPWQAATNMGQALSVMQRGAGDALPTADMILQAMGERRRALPVLIVHGGADAVVSFRNADETSAQWVGVHDRVRAGVGAPPLSSAGEQVAVVNTYTTRRTDWRDAAGVQYVSRIRVDELGHAWSGGSLTGTFTDAKGPNASRLIADFCERHQRP